jgi:hypothetical protein
MQALNRRKLEARLRGPGEHIITVGVALASDNDGRLRCGGRQREREAETAI